MHSTSFSVACHMLAGVVVGFFFFFFLIQFFFKSAISEHLSQKINNIHCNCFYFLFFICRMHSTSFSVPCHVLAGVVVGFFLFFFFKYKVNHLARAHGKALKDKLHISLVLLRNHEILLHNINTQKKIMNKSSIVFEKCHYNNRQSLIWLWELRVGWNRPLLWQPSGPFVEWCNWLKPFLVVGCKNLGERRSCNGFLGPRES